MSDSKLMSYIMGFFLQVGDTANFGKYAGSLEGMAKKLLDENKVDSEDPFFAYRTLVEIYDARKDYQSALDILRRASAQYPNVPDLMSRIQYYEKILQNPSAPDTNKKP
jgi:tetratricopeptide (TPR) repeat protein